MLITDKFVLLNYPKTGSTFARTAIKNIYQNRLSNRKIFLKYLDMLGITARPFLQELLLPNIRTPHIQMPADQHGCYCQIPDEYANLEVVTVVRNPYDRLLSSYEFPWWKRYPPVPDDILAEHFPSFPDLDIDDYIRLNTYGMIHGSLGGRNLKGNIGIQTVQFIQLFFQNPEQVLADICDDYITSDKIFEDIAPVTFLKQEDLNEDLAFFLQERNFSVQETEYVKHLERVNVTDKITSDRQNIWTEASLDYVEQNEQMIFRILSANGITYERPIVQNTH